TTTQPQVSISADVRQINDFVAYSIPSWPPCAGFDTLPPCHLSTFPSIRLIIFLLKKFR
ncbi:Hypothetical predicted protein, partial [Marmota monax]